jgi:hypothetical protein
MSTRLLTLRKQQYQVEAGKITGRQVAETRRDVMCEWGCASGERKERGRGEISFEKKPVKPILSAQQLL